MADLYIDATEQVAGRLASLAAKALLKGDRVVIVNAEKAIVSGKSEMVFREMKTKVVRGDPIHGPFYPRVPDMVLRRLIRGMLPRRPRGKAVIKKLRVFISVPDEFANTKFTGLKQAENKLDCRFVTIGQMCGHITGKKY